MINKTYILLDAMGIQSYIFETNKLKIIVGASLALDSWQYECEKTAKDFGGDVITSAGGNVLTKFEDPDKADEFRKICCLKKQPPEMEIAWARVESKDGKLASEDGAIASKIWQQLQIQITRYKSGDLDAEAYPKKTIPAAPGCEYCGVRPQDGKKTVKDKKICRKCYDLYDRNVSRQPNTGLARLTAYLSNELKKNDFPDNLEQLVTISEHQKDMMAAVVIDLNNMGDTIKSIVHDKGFDGLKEFSTRLKDDILSSIKECIAILDQNQKAILSETDKDGTVAHTRIRMRPLVAAGDDMIFILPAQLWEGFTQRLLNLLAQKGYPACAGVAIAKHAFPVNRLVLMAESLCGNAKQYIRYRNQTDSSMTDKAQCAIDWYVHQESSMTDPLAVRKRKSKKNIIKGTAYACTTGKPYSLPEFAQLGKQKEQWNTISSNRKLYALYSALLKGPEETRETLKYVFLRREKHKFETFKPIWLSINACDGEYPLWNKETVDGKTVHFTGITDQLELRWLKQGREEVNNDD